MGIKEKDLTDRLIEVAEQGELYQEQVIKNMATSLRAPLEACNTLEILRELKKYKPISGESPFMYYYFGSKDIKSFSGRIIYSFLSGKYPQFFPRHQDLSSHNLFLLPADENSKNMVSDTAEVDQFEEFPISNHVGEVVYGMHFFWQYTQRRYPYECFVKDIAVLTKSENNNDRMWEGKPFLPKFINIACAEYDSKSKKIIFDCREFIPFIALEELKTRGKQRELKSAIFDVYDNYERQEFKNSWKIEEHNEIIGWQKKPKISQEAPKTEEALPPAVQINELIKRLDRLIELLAKGAQAPADRDELLKQIEELKRRVQVPDAYSFPFPGPTEIDSLRSFGIIPAHGWDV